MEQEFKLTGANCCVPGCVSSKSRNPHLTFHNFPSPGSSFVVLINNDGKKEGFDRKLAWELALLMDKPANINMKVCSLHFSTTDFNLPGYQMQHARLKRSAVPTRNLPNRSFKRNYIWIQEVEESVKRTHLNNCVDLAEPESDEVTPLALKNASYLLPVDLENDDSDVTFILGLP